MTTTGRQRTAAARTRARAASGVLAVVAWLGCGPAPAPEPLPPAVAELAALGTALPVVETTAIDIGDPAARPHLESGWGGDETSPEGSFAWSGGAAAVLRFDVVEPRDTTFALRGWSFPFDGGETQRITARLDGVEIGSFELGRAPTTARLAVDAGQLVAGENRLELIPARRLERAGEPAWGAGWDALRLLPGEPAAPPGSAPDGALELPARTALRWALEVPAGAWLAWEGMTRDGDAVLEVATRREGGAWSAGRFRGPGRVRLTGAAPALVEIELRAPGAAGALRVTGARLHALPSPAPAAAPAPPADSTRPNLIVYVIDTLRADHLGCYGYGRPTSPRIDELARDAVLWREARAQASWTKPAMGSLLTGAYPITHGADRRANGLAPGVETIGGRLSRAGYRTAFFTTNPTVTAKFDFDRGFDDYRYLSRAEGRRQRSISAAEIHQHVVRWLDERDPARPFLLVVHTLDPHDPYVPGEPYKSRFAPDVDPQVAGFVRGWELAQLDAAQSRERAGQMQQLYDAEIAQNDAAFGALVDELARRGLLERSAVLLVADHGEEFFDHGGWRHAETLYDEVLRVPMILRLPGGARGGTVIEAPADQIDVVPTLLALAGVEVPAELPGGSWLPALAGGAPPDAESLAWLEHPSFSLASVVRGGWKHIRHRGVWRSPLACGPDELFHLVADRGERDDLTARAAIRRHWLTGRLSWAESRFGGAASPDVPIDPELDRALRALGYL